MSHLEKIKKLREKTGAGMVEIQKALSESDGNEEKAVEILRKRGQEKAVKKTDRRAEEGVIVSYVHSNHKAGAMVKLLCETDFVARNDEFKTLARDIAMQVVAADPKCLKPEDFSAEILEKEKEIWTEQLKNEGKNAAMISKILPGKEKKLREESALLTQVFVKNPDQTVEQMIGEKIGKIGENIQVGEFFRMEL